MLLTYLAVVLVAIVVAIVVLPRLAHERLLAVGAVSDFVPEAPARLTALLEPFRVLRFGGLTLNLSPAVDGVLEAVRSAHLPTDLNALEQLAGPVQQLIAAASSLFLGAVGLLIKSVLALAISVYMSIEAPLILAQIEAFMGKEQSAEGRESGPRRVSEGWTEFLRGQFVLMLTIGVVVTLGDLLLGLPGALALGSRPACWRCCPTSARSWPRCRPSSSRSWPAARCCPSPLACLPRSCWLFTSSSSSWRTV